MAIRWSDGTVQYEGAVLDEGEMNYHDDSDFYAVVWTGTEVTRVQYASTRYGGGGSSRIDATPEVIEAAAVWKEAQVLAAWKEANQRQAAAVAKGKRVAVTGGKHAGKEGLVFWMEERRSRYGTWSYGFRCGIALTDRKVGGRYADVIFVDADKLTVIAPEQYLQDEARGIEVAQGMRTVWRQDRILSGHAVGVRL